MFSISVSPVQAASGKRRGAQGQTRDKRGTPDGFSALLEELTGANRQDGFLGSQPRQLSEREQELAQLQRRIEQVNRTLMSFFVNPER